LFRSLLETLTVAGLPTVVVAEDAHWADGATVELLRFLARRTRERALLTIVTYRDDELGANHPLRILLGDLATASTVHRLGLLPLSEDAVRQFADGSGQDASTLHRLTGGNPFFLTEILASGETSVPVTVGDAVLARAARLSPEARAILDVAAVIGATIHPDLLQRVAGPVLDAVEECIARGLLRETGEGLAFRHELTREAILAAVSSPRRQLLHARVLPALRQWPAAAGDLALLAHHAEGARDRDAVLEFAVAAAEQANALHAHREAAAQYARALRFAGGLPAAERARFLEGRSAACYLSDQGGEALTARQAAIAIWRECGNQRKTGENLRWLSRLYWFAGRGPEAEAAAMAAIETLDGLPPGPELAMAYSNIAQLCMLAHDLDGTLLWGERAIALSIELGEQETLIHALANVGTARQSAGDARGEEDQTQSLRLALDGGFLEHACRAMTNLAWDATWDMRLDDAERWLEAATAYATDHEIDSYLRYLRALAAELHARQGKWDAAEADIRYLLGQSALAPLTRIVTLTTWGRLCLWRGSPEAAPSLDEALVLADRTGQLMRQGPVRAARAEAALLAGDPSRARAELHAVRGLAFSRGNRWLRGELAWLLWRAGDRDFPTADLAEPFALLIAGDFVQAAAAWRRIGCPFEEARALAAAAEPATVQRAIPILEQLGAESALRLAFHRLRGLGARELPRLRRGPRPSTRSNPAGLTKREAEVLLLLADGLRNAEIAERLFLAPKTVGHHITSIYAKLGVASRTEAARVAVQLGVTQP
jgi:DNA-binding CsgD family transcriptional regulator